MGHGQRACLGPLDGSGDAWLLEQHGDAWLDAQPRDDRRKQCD